eukprot:COSAG01_NODE_3233_length_6376_cov_6.983750_6_plen_171_part_00
MGVGRQALQHRCIRQAVGGLPAAGAAQPMPAAAVAVAAAPVARAALRRRKAGESEGHSSCWSLCMARDTAILSDKNLLLTAVKQPGAGPARGCDPVTRRRHALAAQRRYISAARDGVGAGTYRFATLSEVYGLQRRRPHLGHASTWGGGRPLLAIARLEGRTKHFRQAVS